MSEDLFNNLEVGGNVFELIEFSLDRTLPNGSTRTGRYGVNVAKVREVVRMPSINPLASSIPGVAGVFELRGIPIPAINLAVALGDQAAELTDSQQIIVTEFSLKRAGFIVNTTQRIRRVEWEKVMPPTADKHTCINGMTLVENNEFLFILDLEKILLDIEEKGGFKNSAVPSFLSQDSVSGSSHQPAPIVESKGVHILLVEDSAVILKNIRNFLHREGYEISTASDGLQAKSMLEKSVTESRTSTCFDVVVTDVEMPKMDGLNLTKWIKDQERLSELPVFFHTSLSGDANLESARQVGANAYVVKNDVQTLLGLLNDLGKS